MKYLLKDRDFQIKLDSLSSENKFSDNLLAAVEKQKDLITALLILALDLRLKYQIHV